MDIASIALALLIVSTSTFILILPIYQIIFAQDNVTQESTEANQSSVSFNTIIAGIVSGGVIGAAATLIGTYLSNRHNRDLRTQELKQALDIKERELKQALDIKERELKHGLEIELLKHRVECYSIAFKLTERTTAVDLTLGEIQTIYDQLLNRYDQEKGALLMSEDSRDGYFGITGVIAGILDLAVESKKTGVAPITEFATPKTRLKLLESSGDFRRSLLRDVGVREKIPKS